jgi:ubiquitin-conjugating enzyme (huntingtin interacting protein 2)
VLTRQGAICLDTLSSQWSPVLTIKSALISLQSLLSTPEPKDPQDAEVASMLIRNPAEFEHKAREWSVKYAGAPKREVAEGSGGATAESIKKKHQQARENEEKVKLAA